MLCGIYTFIKKLIWINKKTKAVLLLIVVITKKCNFQYSKTLIGKSHRRRIGSAFAVTVLKYSNRLPGSVVKPPSVNIFKKRLD